jgi:hypothetical protein
MSSYSATGAETAGTLTGKRPSELQLLVWLIDVEAIISMMAGSVWLLGLLYHFLPAELVMPLSQASLLGGLAAGAAPFLVIRGVVLLTMAHYLWRGFYWARIVFIVLIAEGLYGFVLGLYVHVVMLRSHSHLAHLLRGDSQVVPLLEVLLGGLLLAILFTPRTREYCRG